MNKEREVREVREEREEREEKEEKEVCKEGMIERYKKKREMGN